MLISPAYTEQNTLLHAQRPDYGARGYRYADTIRDLAEKFECKDILDYGSGKGTLRTALEDLRVWEYDPAVLRISKPPVPADLVVCLDVLEHIEPECIEAVLDDLRRCARKACFLTISTKAAQKFLPDGRNAHLIQAGMEWWVPKLRARWKLRLIQGNEDAFVIVGQSRQVANANGAAA